MIMSESYRAEFFEKSEMLISIYNKDLNLIDVNESFLKALNFKKEDILGKNINDFSPDCKSSGRYAIYQNVIKTGVPYVTDQVKLHPSLGSIYLRLSAFKIGDGLGISSKDITDLKETIEDLETFIYKTAHDLRSPVAASRGLINLSILEINNSESVSTYLNLIDKQCETLDRILSKLLDITKVRHGNDIYYLIDFDELIDKIISDLIKNNPNHRINFIKDIRFIGKFYCDRHLLSILIENILDNAIKYQNDSHRDPFVRIKIKNSNNDGVEIKFEDNGIGIPFEHQNNIFKMFYRATNKGGGSGLGLYTAKQCVKKLKGMIIVDSDAKSGSTFTVVIPGLEINPEIHLMKT